MHPSDHFLKATGLITIGWDFYQNFEPGFSKYASWDREFQSRRFSAF